MKEIKLSQQGQINKGKFVALVDDEDYEYLNQFRWCVFNNKYTFYAGRWIREKGRRKLILLHREIMNTPDNLKVDHKDHNGLNCQRFNMRNCTHQQNMSNRKPKGDLKYLGVYLNKHYIRANITVNRKVIYLGSFKTKKEGALAYNEAAIKYHGEFANLNII